MKYYFNKLGIFLAAIGIVFVGFIFIFFKYANIFKSSQEPVSENTSAISITPQAKLKADLLVDFGNGRNISYTQVEINTSDTAYSLLIKKMRETNSQVVTKKYDFGTMVESIDNVTASVKNFWSYSVNGQAGSVAADKYVLKDGDSVEWKYTPLQR